MGNDEFRVPPANRREAKRFEPPPWEADAFKELEQQKARKEPDPELDAAISAVAEQVTAAPEEAAVAAGEPEAESPAAPAARESEKANGGEFDEVRFAALMTKLRDEEPSASNYWVAWVGTGFFMAVLGAVIIVWAMAALVKPDAGQVGTTGGSILLLFGAGFIGGGAWFFYQGLKKRGVL